MLFGFPPLSQTIASPAAGLSLELRPHWQPRVGKRESEEYYKRTSGKTQGSCGYLRCIRGGPFVYSHIKPFFDWIELYCGVILHTHFLANTRNNSSRQCPSRGSEAKRSTWPLRILGLISWRWSHPLMTRATALGFNGHLSPSPSFTSRRAEPITSINATAQVAWYFLGNTGVC